MTLKGMRQTRILKSRAFKCEGERNDHMLHYEQVLVFVLERGESKCCEQVITLPMAQQLKSKNINVVPGQLFAVNVKLNFC